jgi:putative transposase
MARQPRLSVPGYPHHVIVRGNNRQAIFQSRADYETLFSLLADALPQHQVALHSYVLMTNHFHLLVTPQEAVGLPELMREVGRNYVQYYNRKYQRTGTLFEGRYKSTLIQTERYLLACMVYIDLNPVRAGMVGQPQDYALSSYGHYAGMRTDKLVTPHTHVWSLGNTPYAREAAYIALVQSGIAKNDEHALTHSTLHGWALGDEDFVTGLQAQTQRRVQPVARGRPLKSS